MSKKPLNNKPWYELKGIRSVAGGQESGATTLKNQANQNQPAELLIYDVIGDWAGLSARQLVNDLKGLDASEITVRINSPGGSVFDGIAIYNALRHHKAHIHVRIEGLAASIASVIAMAGDTIHMAANALMMIHNPFGWVGGDAEELRKVADMLDKTTEVIAQTYAANCGLQVSEIINLMNEETWFTASEAEGHGLVDVVEEAVQLAAHFDLSVFNHVPKPLLPPFIPPSEPEDENTSAHALAVMSLCNKAGYPEMAEDFIRTHQGIEDVQRRLSECETIKSLCAAAQNTDRAAGFIQSGKSAEQVRTELFDLLTKEDGVVDNTLTPNQQNQTIKPLVDTRAVYQKRNQAVA
ncbi:head maturation protease, ClpP-related [Endozoicomonas atrinae]|uniref:head maturation protease, ClpP-related n=1 Tax=Endozoicomonas atrinae TaxID=1333660 RepID=UPI0008270C64|nr:head maturation protease, ClpP-related [Endozoicomonas atrinae]